MREHAVAEQPVKRYVEHPSALQAWHGLRPESRFSEAAFSVVPLLTETLTARTVAKGAEKLRQTMTVFKSQEGATSDTGGTERCGEQEGRDAPARCAPCSGLRRNWC